MAVHHNLVTAADDTYEGGTTVRVRSPWADDGPRRGKGQPPTRDGINPYLPSSGLQISPHEPLVSGGPPPPGSAAEGTSSLPEEAELDRIIAAELEEHRVFEGFATVGRQITHAELAEQTLLSKDHIGKILRGQRRVNVGTLQTLAAPLGLPHEVRDHLAELIVRNEASTPAAPEPGPAPAEMKQQLTAMPFPAMLLTAGLFDVAAANDAASQKLPRLLEAGNFLRWLVCDPMARLVFAGSGWHEVTTVFTYALHYLSRGTVPEQARAALIAELSTQPEFPRMWTARVDGQLFPLHTTIADSNRPSQATPIALTVSTPWRAPARLLNVSLIPST
ncbi:transcriptional regulator with XRE-family HTH domain [Nocardia kruczakiae]|uniref:Transcriptional regulator with XRE-family HTH domain n=1 Tax=Nocardia kruczakiae TaxID=261477 RepID=A0ABU1XMI5_9NOCA|nr:helix-turn-helix domain-containing protein [Nocardia kruczakiae]MDR7171758.1 transcriptional regulator with XRE-family HTH domain [Nocardia kruczakiae]